MANNTPDTSRPELPALTGQRPEILAIASERRTEMLARIADEITKTAGDAPAELIAEMVALYTDIALRNVAASWWLNNAFASPLTQTLMWDFNDDDRARFEKIRASR